MQPHPKLITRAELAALITELRQDKVSIRQIITYEPTWGLKSCRRDLGKRVIRYDRAASLVLLKSVGVIP